MYYQLKIDNTEDPAIYTLGASGTQGVLDAVGAMGTNDGKYIEVAPLADSAQGPDIDQLWTFVPAPGANQGEHTAYMIQDAFGHRINRQVMMGYNPHSTFVETVSFENPDGAQCWWIPKRNPGTGQTNFYLKDDQYDRCLDLVETPRGSLAMIAPYTGSPTQRFDVSVQYGQTYWGPNSPYQASFDTWRASAPIPANPNHGSIQSTLMAIAGAIGTNEVPGTLMDKLNYWSAFYDGTTGNSGNGANEKVGRAWVKCEAGDWDAVDDDLDPSSEYTSAGAY